VLRPRIIPCLLIHQRGLVKTIGFGESTYVGDPINAVKIFNEKEADELIVLDIDATVENREPNYQVIGHLAAECRMPLCYGGGIRTVEQAKRIVGLGVEKIAVGAGAIELPNLVSSVANTVGTQSVVVVADVRHTAATSNPGYILCSHNGKRQHQEPPIAFVKRMQAAGAGEILVNSIDHDGRMNGYDLEFARAVRCELSVPLTILGGAGSLADIQQLFAVCGVVGAAAGSLFVFKGKYRAVLISYPDAIRREEIGREALSAMLVA
jgi:cyclase